MIRTCHNGYRWRILNFQSCLELWELFQKCLSLEVYPWTWTTPKFLSFAHSCTHVVRWAGFICKRDRSPSYPYDTSQIWSPPWARIVLQRFSKIIPSQKQSPKRCCLYWQTMANCAFLDRTFHNESRADGNHQAARTLSPREKPWGRLSEYSSMVPLETSPKTTNWKATCWVCLANGFKKWSTIRTKSARQLNACYAPWKTMA